MRIIKEKIRRKKFVSYGDTQGGRTSGKIVTVLWVLKSESHFGLTGGMQK